MDIVVWLRERGEWEAVDEIERLRAFLTRLRQEEDIYAPIGAFFDEIETACGCGQAEDGSG
jgi:hypothetical protein